MTASITGETWGDVIEPVREYLLNESKQPLAALRPKLEAAHRGLLESLEGVSNEQAQVRPAEGEGEDAWGIAEVLRHVASAQALMAERVRLLGSGESTESLRPSQPGGMHG
ncbi:MAG: DinB family protein, partial [Chloroflexi bacterium]|nr:DinB family protein [Chloroflexota bacterium]